MLTPEQMIALATDKRITGTGVRMYLVARATGEFNYRAIGRQLGVQMDTAARCKRDLEAAGYVTRPTKSQVLEPSCDVPPMPDERVDPPIAKKTPPVLPTNWRNV